MAEEITDSSLSDAAAVTLQTGNDLIDATQNAIIDAAENVSEVFDKANPDIAHQLTEVPFYADVEFWVGMAFILSIVVLAKPAYRFLKSAMRGKIESVKNQIADAEKLRDDAQELLAQYERKFAATESEVAEILKQAEKNIANQKKNDLATLKENTAVKEKEIKRRILSSTENAMAEINQSVARSSVEVAKKAILAHISKANKSALIDEAIAGLDKFIK
ncbi:MAG: ATP synthase F0 subunit B [Alphaproteobacteria bacterium]|nr:ATP synthase F0 subunit B [Alphaproteobacteria bacterium]MDY4689805.1 ATP synthase F0 subunit B [Alphaproteobacteria bacterium]